MAPSLTGRTLKKEWRVGKLLGAGACAEVYEVERVAVTARSGSRAAAAAAASTTSLVVKVAPVPPPAAKGKKANGDAKRAADTLFTEHLLYANVLNRSPRRFGREVAYGESDGLRYLVLERLANALEKNRRQPTRPTPPLSTTAVMCSPSYISGISPAASGEV